ncbi:MAG: hypothetical protein ING00_05575 [Roseomonas sp.]|nr:hypothetical protein [Roseomonas sp.]
MNNHKKEARPPLIEAYRDRKTARTFCIFFGVFTGFFMIMGIFLAIFLRDAHIVNRFGGSLTALSLLLVLYQFKFENRRKHDENHFRDFAARVQIDRFYPPEIQQGIEDQLRDVADELEGIRYLILITSVFIGIVGELIHAWGDLTLYWLMPSLFGKAH